MPRHKVPNTPMEELYLAKRGFDQQYLATERTIAHSGGHSRHRGRTSIWAGNIEGTAAEFNVARYTGLPWTGARLWVDPPPRTPDVGDDIEVRWTGNVWRPELCIYPQDGPHLDWRYVLVTGFLREQEIVGYIYGNEIVRLLEEHLARKDGDNVFVVEEGLHDLPPG